MEDGFLETASAVILLAASVQALRVAIGTRGYASYRIMHAFLGLLFFPMAGEEISWGQRILWFGPPDWMANVNAQGELNLHNMYGYLFDHLFILLFFLWGCVCHVLYRSNGFFRQQFRFFGLPIASAGLAIAMLVATLCQDQLVMPFFNVPFGLRTAELREFLSCACFLLLMVESHRGFVQSARNPEPGMSC